MAERKSLSKSVRFEVFKRDSFTCQYCGAKAPDVILEIDHINPVCKGGKNDLMNLITSCRDCNRGKGKKKISDNSTIARQRAQIEELNLRRQQLEMLLKWREGLSLLESDICNTAVEYWNNKWEKVGLSEIGVQKMSVAVRRFGLNSVLEMIDLQFDKHYDFQKSEKDNSNFIFEKVLTMLNCNSMPPHRQKIAYIKGILKNKMPYFNQKKFYTLIKGINNEESLPLLNFISEELKLYGSINYSELEYVISGLIHTFNTRSNE